MARIAIIAGTRPEFIKLGPVVAELRQAGVEPAIVATGQHWDLLRGTPAETDLRTAESLGLASDGDMTRWLTRAENSVRGWLEANKVTCAVVQGDTMSALAGARAGAELGLAVVHVEAGVRSHDASNPWPEEAIRVEIAKLANWHLAPTTVAVGNLLAEGVLAEQIELTGNTVVSALARYASTARPVERSEALVVVTMHRREIQTPAVAAEVYTAVYELAMTKPGWRVFWPVHPAFWRVLPTTLSGPGMPPNVTLSTSMPYEQFVANVAHARLVVTDSGGLVEEAATLGVPTVIWRAVNDRPEAVAAGIAIVAAPTRVALPAAVEAALLLPRRPSAAFGRADAAERVARFLVKLLNRN